MGTKLFRARLLALSAAFATATTSAVLLGTVQGCGSGEDTTDVSAGDDPALPLPAELNFKKIEQEFQQQNQQVGQFCPDKGKAEIFPTGQVRITNQVGQEVIKGWMQQNDFARVAQAANEVVQQGVQQEVDCKAAEDPSQQADVSQLFVTDQDEQTEIVAAKKDDQFCDFSKEGKGKQLQQQVNRVIQQGCNNQLPKEDPRPRPTPTPTVTPTPTPTATPTPTPTPTATATPTPTPTPTSTTMTTAVPTDTPTATPTASTNDRAPSGNADRTSCLAAVEQTRNLFSSARQCASDDDCNYVVDFDVVDRGNTNEFIPVFRCGNAAPGLFVANGRYLSENAGRLQDAVAETREACGLRDFMTDCQARGGFVAAIPPVCRSNVCVRGR